MASCVSGRGQGDFSVSFFAAQLPKREFEHKYPYPKECLDPRQSPVKFGLTSISLSTKPSEVEQNERM
jgi:hypothetical protein